MTIHLKTPDLTELRPRIAVIGVGGAGGNALNNMIAAKLDGVHFIAANTDAQALIHSKAETKIQLGAAMTEGLGAGAKPEIGAAAAEQSAEEIKSHLRGLHMAFITAGMGGGTGTGAAPVIAKVAREEGVLTVGVVTKPFHFEGQRRMRAAEWGIQMLAEQVDTLIVIPNQNLFRVAVVNTTFSEAFAMADQVLHDGIACITEVMVKDGIINLDFADVNLIMRGMGAAMMGTGVARGENRGRAAAESAISNPLLDDVSLKGAKGLLVSIIGGKNDLTLYEVDEAANRVREEVDPDANIIVGTAFDESLDGVVRVSVVATGLETRRERGGEPLRGERTPAAAVPADGARGGGLGERLQKVRPEPRAESPVPPPHPQPQPQPQPQTQPQHAERPPAAMRPEGEGIRIEKRAPSRPHMPPVGEVARREPVYAHSAAPAREAAGEPPLKADPSVRMPSIGDFPPQAQELLRQHAEQGANHPARPWPFRRLASSVKDGLLGAKERSVSVSGSTQPRPQNAGGAMRIDPVLMDPHVKGGALSRAAERAGQTAADRDDDTEFPSFLRK
jgi:cell division protein FtsZ